MKLRVKIKELSMSLQLAVDEPDASVQGVTARIADEVAARIGLRITACQLSLNGRDPLAESVRESALSELGVVSGDQLHVLDAQFDPPLTQRVVAAEPPPPSLHVEPRPVGQQGDREEGGEPDEAERPVAESSEPLLVRDARPGRLPRLLTWLAERAPADSPEHLLVLALHALMLEAGLQPLQPEPGHGAAAGGFRPSVAPAVPGPAAEAEPAPAGPEPPSHCRTAGYFPGGPPAPRRWHLPPGWKRPGLYQITYGLHFNMALTAVLSAVPMGNVMVVHAVPAGGAQIFSVTLRPRDFIAATESGETAERFQNLRQLSNTFKNGITVPLLVALQRSVGLVSPHEWRALPLELQLLVLRRLSAPDLLRMRCTSREMRLRADDPLLWRDLVCRDFPSESGSLSALEPSADWKALYIQLHRRRAELRRRPEWFPGAAPPPLPLPPVPSGWFEPAPMAPPIAGIIGGEYDRLPSLGFQPPLALPRARLDSLLPAGRRRFGSDPAAATFLGGGRLM
ncbi:F-box only protein 7-like [Amphibalanus amphitrite]|uniref:F-box only protein 7-like n=1 Tax=Amphibalanus amphitrite TaxID=1232801 RepID=UPI001C9215BA|nr:F-box only protein 7-like [Amphibalanus amphitrite]